MVGHRTRSALCRRAGKHMAGYPGLTGQKRSLHGCRTRFSPNWIGPQGIIPATSDHVDMKLWGDVAECSGIHLLDRPIQIFAKLSNGQCDLNDLCHQQGPIRRFEVVQLTGTLPAGDQDQPRKAGIIHQPDVTQIQGCNLYAVGQKTGIGFENGVHEALVSKGSLVVGVQAGACAQGQVPWPPGWIVSVQAEDDTGLVGHNLERRLKRKSGGLNLVF